jgi:hypothetical protein
MHAHSKNKTSPAKTAVLTKAIKRLSVELDLSRHELSLIIGRSESTLSRLFNNEFAKDIDPSSKEGEQAILLLRIYRNLDALFGGNSRQSQLWLRSENAHLGKKPIDLIVFTEGLVTVVHYLEAIRGKN